MSELIFNIEPCQAAVDNLLETLMTHAKGDGLDTAVRFQLFTCVAEALNNILEHSSLEHTSPNQRVSLNYQYRHHLLSLKIEHKAPPYEITEGDLNDVYATSGRGWQIMKAWLDHLIYCHRNGVNTLLMVKST